MDEVYTNIMIFGHAVDQGKLLLSEDSYKHILLLMLLEL